MIATFHFDSADEKTAFPFELSKNGLFFKARMNGSRPLWFSLDSGASWTFIDHNVAESLGLQFAGTRSVQGAGEGSVEVRVIEDVSIELPGLVSRGHEVLATDLRGLDWGRALEGFLGYDILERFVTIIDYQAGVMTLVKPSRFLYRGPGSILPLEFQGRLPFVSGVIKVANHPPEESLFLVDSGSQDAVDHPIIAKSGEARATRAGVGLGRSSTGFFGPVETFQLGPFKMHNLGGVGIETGLGARLIGGQVLSRFKVIFDYSRQRLILESSNPKITDA